ncbi:MAG TPA: roadblock/LC7 domain-containing protein, partial [Gemmatimonadales bacterium]
ARMLGEAEFGSLFHQGERESLYLADVARRVILVVLFDNRTTLGLVKLRVRRAVVDLSTLFEELFSRGGQTTTVEAGFVGEAEDEIDRLFGAM